MKEKLVVLLVEDNLNDANLLSLELGKNFDLTIHKVETEEEYRGELNSFTPDIILSDYNLPTFDGLKALLIKQHIAPLIPFILVTGSINEETAVEVIKAGADDYIIKEHLNRLQPAIKSAIEKKTILQAKEETEKALNLSEDLFRRVINNVDEIIYSVSFTEGLWNSKVNFVSEQAKKILGYEPGEFLHNSNLWFSIIHPDDSNMVTEQIHSMYENNKSVTRIYRMRHKLTGESIWIEDNPQLLYDDEGNIIGLFGTARDITKRKNTELALQDSEALYHSLVENIPASIFRKDYAGRYVFVNSRFCQLKGMSKDEILGKTPLELASYELTKVLVPGLSSEMSTKQRTITQGAEHHELIVRTGQQIEIEEIYSQPDGTSQHFQVIKSPIFNFDGIIIGTQGIQFNITEKKKLIDDLIAAKEKAEQMTRLKSNFLANMSHELRTPLVGILGFSEILTSELDDPKHLNLVNDIYKSGKRLSDTLNLILNLSKAESGNIELNANIFNADTITKQRVNLFRPAAAVKNLSMELIVKDDNVFTKLDEHLFASVLDNLINNAVKFTNDGTITVEIGKVIVSAKPWFYVKVKDTGIGISEDNLNIIFDEFRQVSEGYGRSFEGTGLGLTITKKITELMGGVISVESEFDVGSVFTVKFPALENILQEETAYDSA